MVRSLKMEVQSYKKDNKRLMREKIKINARVFAELKLVAETNEEGIKLKTRGIRYVP
jgi:hypothetical protein